MEGDEYLCKNCKKKWKDEKKGTAFCTICYSREIVNLSEIERTEAKKKKDEEAARKRREERIQREKEYRTRILKTRDTSVKYYRGKNK